MATVRELIEYLETLPDETIVNVVNACEDDYSTSSDELDLETDVDYFEGDGELDLGRIS